MNLSLVAAALSLAAATVAAPGEAHIKAHLPPRATVVATERLDLTGDGRPELVVGYTLPRAGLPPTEGRAAVLEPDAKGEFRRFDLPGGWPGHYPPRFSVHDLTGDGRPELVLQVAGGGAWQMLWVFRRAADTYESLLLDAALGHVLWDADGDGRPEVIGRHRLRSMGDQALQRFIWREGRFVAWHAPEWSYSDLNEAGGAEPDLRGLTLEQAQGALSKAGLSLGVIAELDVPGPGGRVIRQECAQNQVHVAVGAGDTAFDAPMLPPVEAVHYFAHVGPGSAPVASTPTQLAVWRKWLQGLASDVKQVVHTRFLRGPAHVIELHEPWTVTIGGRKERIRWVGVGMAPPDRGLLYLASEAPRPGYHLPRFQAALYIGNRAVQPPIPAATQPLRRYLQTHREVDAFITLRPNEWAEAIRHRGIRPDGWPAPRFGPHLEGPATPDPHLVPDPDHVKVTVLNGFVRRAVRKGDDITVEVVSAPGRVYRWLLPLTGFNQSTRVVRIHLTRPGEAPRTIPVALDSWISWNGDPGPGSLTGP